MNTLNLGSDDEPVIKKKSKSRNLKIALGLAAVILIPTIGVTLAGNITIGTANSVEFGQGFTATTSCDSDGITVVPSSVLTEGTFNLESITVTGIADACGTKKFTIKVLNSSNALQTIGTGSATSCKVNFETSTAVTSSTGACIVNAYSSTSFTLSAASGVTLAAANVYKITLETSSS